MTWNYRIVRDKDRVLTLREVYYDENGNPTAMSSEPITLRVFEDEGETLHTFLDILDKIKESIMTHGVLDDPWP